MKDFKSKKYSDDYGYKLAMEMMPLKTLNSLVRVPLDRLKCGLKGKEQFKDKNKAIEKILKIINEKIKIRILDWLDKSLNTLILKEEYLEVYLKLVKINKFAFNSVILTLWMHDDTSDLGDKLFDKYKDKCTECENELRISCIQPFSYGGTLKPIIIKDIIYNLTDDLKKELIKECNMPGAEETIVSEDIKKIDEAITLCIPKLTGMGYKKIFKELLKKIDGQDIIEVLALINNNKVVIDQDNLFGVYDVCKDNNKLLEFYMLCTSDKLLSELFVTNKTIIINRDDIEDMNRVDNAFLVSCFTNDFLKETFTYHYSNDFNENYYGKIIFDKNLFRELISYEEKKYDIGKLVDTYRNKSANEIYKKYLRSSVEMRRILRIISIILNIHEELSRVIYFDENEEGKEFIDESYAFQECIFDLNFRNTYPKVQNIPIVNELIRYIFKMVDSLIDITDKLSPQESLYFEDIRKSNYFRSPMKNGNIVDKEFITLLNKSILIFIDSISCANVKSTELVIEIIFEIAEYSYSINKTINKDKKKKENEGRHDKEILLLSHMINGDMLRINSMLSESKNILYNLVDFKVEDSSAFEFLNELDLEEDFADKEYFDNEYFDEENEEGYENNHKSNKSLWTKEKLYNMPISELNSIFLEFENKYNNLYNYKFQDEKFSINYKQKMYEELKEEIKIRKKAKKLLNELCNKINNLTTAILYKENELNKKITSLDKTKELKEYLKNENNTVINYIEKLPHFDKKEFERKLMSNADYLKSILRNELLTAIDNKLVINKKKLSLNEDIANLRISISKATSDGKKIYTNRQAVEKLLKEYEKYLLKR